MKALESAIGALLATGDGEILEIDGRMLMAQLASCIGDLDVRLHPLGFYHVELTSLLPSPIRRVRLHVWDGLVQADDMGLVHDHMWSLTSAILAGGLTNILFDTAIDLDGPYDGMRVRYGSQNSFEFEARYALSESRRDEFGYMQVYRVPARVAHLTLITEFPTVTLAVTVNEADVRGPVVFSGRGQPEGTPVRASGNPSHVSSILRALSSVKSD